MPNLKSQVETSSAEFKNAIAAIRSLKTSFLPSAIIANWEDKSNLNFVLDGTLELFSARDEAWNRLEAMLTLPPFLGDDNVEHPEFVVLDGRKISFACARHLALVAYVTVTWSIYDRLANVCGRLAAAKNVGKDNPKQNPKLVEDFLLKDKRGDWFLGFFCHHLALEAYYVPIQVSYKVRNWVVHEGYEFGDVAMFEGGSVSHGLTLSEDAVKVLKRASLYEPDGDRIKCSCIKAGDDPLERRDLYSLLRVCQNETDCFFQGMVRWSISSFVLQIKAFSDRN